MYNIATETLLQQHFKNTNQTKPEINNYKNKIKKIENYKNVYVVLYAVYMQFICTFSKVHTTCSFLKSTCSLYALLKSAYKLHINCI